ncbi:hypothetical protein GCM10029992_05540 [Glycomyces albus]
MADKYEAETGIKVEIDDVPYDDFNTRLRNAAQADGLPDLARVTAIDPIWMNQLQDLSGIASEHGVMDNLLVENADGEIPTLPTDLTAVGLFINKSLFDSAGVAYPTTPTRSGPGTPSSTPSGRSKTPPGPATAWSWTDPPTACAP